MEIKGLVWRACLNNMFRNSSGSVCMYMYIGKVILQPISLEMWVVQDSYMCTCIYTQLPIECM